MATRPTRTGRARHGRLSRQRERRTAAPLLRSAASLVESRFCRRTTVLWWPVCVMRTVGRPRVANASSVRPLHAHCRAGWSVRADCPDTRECIDAAQVKRGQTRPLDSRSSKGTALDSTHDRGSGCANQRVRTCICAKVPVRVTRRLNLRLPATACVCALTRCRDPRDGDAQPRRRRWHRGRHKWQGQGPLSPCQARAPQPPAQEAAHATTTTGRGASRSCGTERELASLARK